MPVVTSWFLALKIFFQPKITNNIPVRITTLDMGTITPMNMEMNNFSPVTAVRRYHKVATLFDPKAQVKKYMVKGKPYISMYRATINAK